MCKKFIEGVCLEGQDCKFIHFGGTPSLQIENEKEKPNVANFIGRAASAAKDAAAPIVVKVGTNLIAEGIAGAVFTP